MSAVETSPKLFCCWTDLAMIVKAVMGMVMKGIGSIFDHVTSLQANIFLTLLTNFGPNMLAWTSVRVG